MRLADVDKILKDLENNPNLDFSMCDACWGEIYTTIDNAPTVEQPTGEWVYLFTFLDSKIYECTHCKGRLSLDIPQRIEDFKFCNGCGAKMKEGEKNE